MPVIETLVDCGLGTIELTFTSPGVIDELERARARYGDDLVIGMGTVTSLDLVDAAIDAGAQFIVTPDANLPVVERAVERGLPVLAGALTPTEVRSVWQAGAAGVKLFPAVTVGPAFIPLLLGPFPDLRVVPSGGIELDRVGSWLRAGASMVGLGSSLLGDALDSGSLESLRVRCASLVDEVDGWI